MDERTISVIALSARDYPSFEAKLQEAVRWIEVASVQGADLVVLPETLNIYQGDGPGNPNAMRMEEAALDDWESTTGLLRDAAIRFNLAVTVPVLIRENGHLVNAFFVVSRTGEILGSYRKRNPAYGEDREVLPGKETDPLIDWEGIKVGGAICFDTWFPEVFASQAAAGAQLFLVPSLWPGGTFLNAAALRHSTPIAVAYPAWSRIIDIDGREAVAGGYRNETLRFGYSAPVYTTTLNFDRVTVHADFAQQKMVEIQLAYGEQIRIRFDQDNLLFYLESRSPELKLEEVLKRFELVTLQQFFANYEMRRSENFQRRAP